MCSPLIASSIIGAASTATSLIGQSQQASAQRQAQAVASRQERERYLAEVSAMRTQQQQEALARSQNLNESSRRAMEARATATTAAGEAGVSGLSVNALLGDLSRQQAEYEFSVQRQAQLTDVNRQLALREAGIGFSRNMLRINQPISQPDYLGSAVQGVQTGLSNYGVIYNSGLFEK
jgi:hypothetical protein|tara:strand:+ start:114 stop:647 length:534 start_codon:yes stop_codon:yes gene_type:complete